MAQESRFVRQPGGYELPAPGESLGQQRVGVGHALPDGDRRQPAESGGIEDHR